MMNKSCSATTTYGVACRRNATCEYQGHNYCTIHSPEYKKLRAESKADHQSTRYFDLRVVECKVIKLAELWYESTHKEPQYRQNVRLSELAQAVADLVALKQSFTHGKIQEIETA